MLQVFTEESLQLCLDMTALSSHRSVMSCGYKWRSENLFILTRSDVKFDDTLCFGFSGFCIVGNSLLAYASVNHLHYHILYVNEPVLAARVVRHVCVC